MTNKTPLNRYIRKLKSLRMTIFSCSFGCNWLCHFTNGKLRRIHASCTICRLRKWYYKAQGTYNLDFMLVFPEKFTIKTTMLNNSCTFAVVCDDLRFMRTEKEILQNALIRIAERMRYPTVSKKVYTLIELLA